ncbi:MAG TPA: hypothetical protein DCO77_13145 [Nitrospiraceae bacterium]|nr:hypothetical protein [Nitrospiraceae bacterium]
MKIAILIEGKTEKSFIPILREFLQPRLVGRMPRLDPLPYDGRIPTGDKLKRVVTNLLNASNNSADAVIALTDVYTGTNPPAFKDATDAKLKMRKWVGNETRFYPHAAQYDFEAWLLPYWPDITRLAGHNEAPPGHNPEQVNHNNPPAHRISNLFRCGSGRKCYVKGRDAARILRGKDLSVAANACPELKSFMNTILSICNGNLLA